MTTQNREGRPLVIATRGSKLALWQADYVSSLLQKLGAPNEKLVLKTTGDRVQDRFLHEIGGKGLFVKELEQALLDGTADLAVHSLKDMTARLAKEFTLAAILRRHSPADRIIFHPKLESRLAKTDTFGAGELRELGALTIGTGSLRRQASLKKAVPGATCVGIRGNVDTRLKKLHDGDWDAIILAEASLDRLGIKDVVSRRLDPQWFVPCAAQGALAIETTASSPVRSLIAALGDAATTLHVTIERALLARLGGDCTMPFACHVAPSAQDATELRGIAVIYDRDGNEARVEHTAKTGAGFSAETYTAEFAQKLKAAGAAKILRNLGLEVPAEFA